jgi:hypothetical protein
MNERIKKLADSADWLADNKIQTPGEYHPDWHDVRDEFFTELILSDIENILDDLYRATPLEQAAVLLTLDENIKKHFYGVENV